MAELAGAGRPRRYCSLGCKRSADYEVKRLQQRLLVLESELESERGDPLGLTDISGRTPRQRAAALELAIERCETRLRLLLDDEAVSGEPGATLAARSASV